VCYELSVRDTWRVEVKGKFFRRVLCKSALILLTNQCRLFQVYQTAYQAHIHGAK
jgi:hypothetical protein